MKRRKHWKGGEILGKGRKPEWDRYKYPERKIQMNSKVKWDNTEKGKKSSTERHMVSKSSVRK